VPALVHKRRLPTRRLYATRPAPEFEQFFAARNTIADVLAGPLTQGPRAKLPAN
jgi:hypothetical protein